MGNRGDQGVARNDSKAAIQGMRTAAKMTNILRRVRMISGRHFLTKNSYGVVKFLKKGGDIKVVKRSMSAQLYLKVFASTPPGGQGDFIVLVGQSLSLTFRVRGKPTQFQFKVDAVQPGSPLFSPSAANDYLALASQAWSRYAMLQTGAPYSKEEMLAKLGRAIVLGRTFRSTDSGGSNLAGLSVISQMVLSSGGRPMKVNFVETDFVLPDYWHAGIGKAQVRHLLEALSHTNGTEGYIWGAALMQNPVMYGALLHNPMVDLDVPDVRSVDAPVQAPYDRVMPELANLVVGGGVSPGAEQVDYDPDLSLVRGHLQQHPTRAFRSADDLPEYRHKGQHPDPVVNDYFRKHLFDESGQNLFNDLLVLFRFRTS